MPMKYFIFNIINIYTSNSELKNIIGFFLI